MSKEERHLQTKIRMFEDILLRTKNPSQVDNIQMELTRMRAKLQKLYFKNQIAVGRKRPYLLVYDGFQLVSRCS